MCSLLCYLFLLSCRSPISSNRICRGNDSPNSFLEEGPEWGRQPSPGHLALIFTVALSRLQTLYPRTFVMTPLVVLPLSLPTPATPSLLECCLQPHCSGLRVGELGCPRSPRWDFPSQPPAHHTKPPDESSTTYCLSEDSQNLSTGRNVKDMAPVEDCSGDPQKVKHISVTWPRNSTPRCTRIESRDSTNTRVLIFTAA